MTTNLETRIRDFVREQKNGMFYNDDGSEIEPIDFNNFNNVSIFLDTAVALLEEVIRERKTVLALLEKVIIERKKEEVDDLVNYLNKTLDDDPRE